MTVYSWRVQKTWMPRGVRPTSSLDHWRMVSPAGSCDHYERLYAVSRDDTVIATQRQANTAAWARWYMSQSAPSYTYAQPVVQQSPRCYHVTAGGGCAHWGP